jgi:hypothetical protein
MCVYCTMSFYHEHPLKLIAAENSCLEPGTVHDLQRMDNGRKED